MNSVLQQLFMSKGLKEGVRKAEEACTDPNEDFSGEEKFELEPEGDDDDRGDYDLIILKQVNRFFDHPTPVLFTKGLWRYFDMQGEPVNPRE